MSEQLMNEFEEVGAEEVSTNELDQAVKDYADARREAEAAKEVRTKLYAIEEEKEMYLVSLLNRAGKKKYQVDTIGTISISSKMQVTTPKTPEDKAALFEWLRSNLGEEGYLAYASVNSQSLNSLYKEMLAKSEDPAMFRIAGVDTPTEKLSLSFRKEK